MGKAEIGKAEVGKGDPASAGAAGYGGASGEQGGAAGAASVAGRSGPGPVSPLAWDGPGGVVPAGEMLKVLREIREEIAGVRGAFVELRTSKERLEGMLGDGLFGFTRKVDAESFKVLCAVLAEGDVAKASRALEMPDASVRTLMRGWRRMGREYQAMLDLVRWRKSVGRRERVALNENVLLEKASSVDYPGLLADVLEGLLSMTEENWQERCEELAELLRPAAGG